MNLHLWYETKTKTKIQLYLFSLIFYLLSTLSSCYSSHVCPSMYLCFIHFIFRCFNASKCPSSVHPYPFIHLSFNVLHKGEWVNRSAKQPYAKPFNNSLLPVSSILLSSFPSFPLSFAIILKALDVAIGLQWWKENVEEPQADKQHGGQDLCSPGPAKLSANLRSPSVHQSGNRNKGKYGKEGDRESQSAWINFKVLSLAVVVDGSNGPCHLKCNSS